MKKENKCVVYEDDYILSSENLFPSENLYPGMTFDDIKQMIKKSNWTGKNEEKKCLEKYIEEFEILQNENKKLKEENKKLKNEKNNYMAMYNGKITQNLALASKKKAEINPITGSATLNAGNLKVVLKNFSDLKGKLGVNTHKLLSVGIATFTDINNYSKKEEKNAPLQYEVSIPLNVYIFNLGYDIIKHPTNTLEEEKAEKKRVNNILKETKKKIRKDLDILRSIELTWDETTESKSGDFDSVSLIGSRSIRNGYINMTFDPNMAKYLSRLPLTQYPIRLLRVDARNSNAYIMGLKFTEHYNMDNNQVKKTANKLKVEKLLRYLSLPSYTDVFKARKSWEERIKEPFEKSLDELTKKRVLENWEYTAAKGVKLTDAEATSKKYDEWKNFYIEYTLSEAPDHTKRLKAKAEAKNKKVKAKREKKK